MDITETFVYGLTLIRIFGGLLFFYAYLKSKRKSALLIALSWFLVIPSTTFGILFDLRVENVFIGLAYGFMILGFFELINEEKGLLRAKSLYLIPLVVMVFGFVESIVEVEPEDCFVISGIFAFIAAFILAESLKRIYGKDVIIMGLSIAISGIITPFYPVYHEKFENKSPILLGVLLFTFLTFFFYYRIIFSERFFKTIPQATIETPELRGVHLESPEEFENLKESLKDYPVLAFMRGLNSPEGWTTYKFSTIEGENVIYPTDLYRITDLVFRYLTEAKNKGVKGVVVLEGLEFLRVYNDFKAVAKMIASVRDYVLSYEGALIVVLDEKAWDEKELNTLKRMLL
ncbi:DUF835 domain-containing protein [Thermococcus bergensis]|uniref:DUF835 domain-containing protein n=1 Tax=Thermococcus bergensis TaxID=2689387 RepID=UPI001CEC4DA5|nr:DUF835 domain-containing protein [Thermococcus bergensis]MCA6214279.1 DUF835 domain-containing protein [Thermococcus bergensis]